jgi:peptide/nickel transport system permease protein
MHSGTNSRHAGASDPITPLSRTSTFYASAQEWLSRFADNPPALLGACIVLLMLLVAGLAPQLALYDPNETAVSNRLAPLSVDHPFGTDQFGRDLYSRVIYGVRISMTVGLLAVGLGLGLGIPLGAVAGYFGRFSDNIIMRLMDTIMAFPGLLLAIALVAAFGPSLYSLSIALGIRNTVPVARLVRASVLEEREKEYVEAAKIQGESKARILCHQILPNCLSPLIVQATLDFAHAIIAESSLSFLGLGIPPPTPSWGTILDDARTYMVIYPWGAVFPGLAIFLAVLGFNFLGDGLRDVLDPRLAQEQGAHV